MRSVFHKRQDEFVGADKERKKQPSPLAGEDGKMPMGNMEKTDNGLIPILHLPFCKSGPTRQKALSVGKERQAGQEKERTAAWSGFGPPGPDGSQPRMLK